MSATTPDHTQEDGVGLIECYFDLEQASSQCDSESVDHSSTTDSGEGNVGDPNSNIIASASTTSPEEDSYVEQIVDAILNSSDPVWRGPFMFPHSATVFMGNADIFGEQRTEKTDAMPKPPPLPKPPKPDMVETLEMAEMAEMVDMAEITETSQMPQMPLAYAYTYIPQGSAYGFQSYHQYR
ncbi:hypothetical protein F5B17DRAFT_427693 [Nemania serpens]|nr:hypothetical protein F5B17DRAFT_427693 [Nemania serpens]